jgi:nucleoside-diphosphate-sugar epimerase
MESDLAHFKGKKVLITGGGGYLGSKLAEYLFKSDAQINLMDISFNDLSIKLSNINKNFIKYNVDLANKAELVSICNKISPNIIFHFGALLNRERDFLLYPKLYEVNVQGTLNLLEALRFVDYEGFYFSSSSEVYGNTNKGPFHEEMIPSPASPYSLTKLMAENLIKSFSGIYHKPFTICRLFNFFGEDMSESFFINQLIGSLKKEKSFEMTSGEQTRDFLHIDDVVKAINCLSNSNHLNGEIINICSGRGIKLKDVAYEIASKLNKEHLLKIGAIPYRENEVWEMVGSNAKLKNAYYLSSNCIKIDFKNLF